MLTSPALPPPRPGITFALYSTWERVSPQKPLNPNAPWSRIISIPSVEEVVEVMQLKPSETFATILVKGNLESEREFLFTLSERLHFSQKEPLQKALKVPKIGAIRHIKAVRLFHDSTLKITRAILFE